MDRRQHVHGGIVLTIAAVGIAMAFTSCGPLQLSFKDNTPQTKTTVPITTPSTTPVNTTIEKPETIAQQLQGQTQIYKFSDYNALKEFLDENVGSGSSGYYGGGIMTVDAFEDEAVRSEMKMAVPEAAPTAGDSDFGATTNTSSGSDDYSTTNVQVEGVDEADIVKTDGKYIYVVSKNNLYIVDAYPATNSSVVSKIAFKSYPQDIYIKGDTLIVYGRNDYISTYDAYDTFRRYSNYTFLKVFDISDRKNPKQIKDMDFEGDYNNSRMIGNYLYFVTNYYQYGLVDDVVIPRLFEDGTELSIAPGEPKCNCPEVYYFDVPYSNYNFTRVSVLDLNNLDGKVESDVYLLSGGQNMYVSQKNMYITYTKYLDERDLMLEVALDLVVTKLPAKDQQRIADILAAKNYVLSKEEKLQKVGLYFERYYNTLSESAQDALTKQVEDEAKRRYQDISKELEKTVIHKIAIAGGQLEYKTFGEVTGQVLNQFSMDEHDGYFRIATTKNRTWSQFLDEEQEQSYNNLYVLDENLKQVGAVEKLAVDESIYSVRFMQDRAYMVTFRQVDPLFVIDLKDPRAPKVLGQLKIPGFSNYLHPYGENYVIGLGKETKENEWGGVNTLGLKVSLFDVRDVNNPIQKDVEVVGDAGSDSIALRDHKAFLFSDEKDLLVIPATLYEDNDDGRTRSYRHSFRGALVFKITEEGLDLRGRIDHSTGTEEDDEYYGYYGRGYYDTTVQRSLFIDDILYTLSNTYIKMNALSNLSEVKTLELKKLRTGEEGDFEVVN